MKQLRLMACLAAALPLVASANPDLGTAAPADKHHTFVVANDTDAPTDQSCLAGTLEAKCDSGSWTTIGDSEVKLVCGNTEGLKFREASGSENSVAWSCSVDAADAPADARHSIQTVTVTGTLATPNLASALPCSTNDLAAQDNCSYKCRTGETDSGGAPVLTDC